MDLGSTAGILMLGFLTVNYVFGGAMFIYMTVRHKSVKPLEYIGYSNYSKIFRTIILILSPLISVLFCEWRSHASLNPITMEEYLFFNCNISMRFRMQVRISRPILALVPPDTNMPLSENQRFLGGQNTGRGSPSIDANTPRLSQIKHSVNPDDPKRENLLLKKQMGIALVAKYEKDAQEKSKMSSISGRPKSDANRSSEYEKNMSTGPDSIEPMSLVLKRNYGNSLVVPGTGRKRKQSANPSPEISSSGRVKKSRATINSGVRDYGPDQEPTALDRAGTIP